MDRSRLIPSATDELKQIRGDIRLSTSLDSVRHTFERLQELRRQHVDDFDLQLAIADAQQEIIERAQALRRDSPSSALQDTHGQPEDEFDEKEDRRVSEPKIQPPKTQPPTTPPEDAAEIPPDVPKLDQKSWKLAVGLAVLFTAGICALFFYMIQTARKVYFYNESPAVTTGPQTTGSQTPAPAKVTDVALVPIRPTLRLYTDLTGGTATLDDQPPRELTDGELDIDSLTPGVHTVKVESHSGSAEFTFALDNDKDVPRATEIVKSSNSMVVTVSVKDGVGRLNTDTPGAVVDLDNKPAGVAGADSLLLSDLGKRDHNLEISREHDQQKFVLTYTPAPTLTVFVKSDPSIGVLTVSTSLDGVSVLINDQPYKRLTDKGQVRIPLKVGTYRIGVHKDGYLDPAIAIVEVKKSEEASVQFVLQPPPAQEFASLQIKGAQPGTVASLDHQVAATVGVDGTAKVINIKPGDHFIELNHDQAVTKQFTRTFAAGQTVTLANGDAVLDRLAADNKSVIPTNPGPPVIPPPALPPPVDQSNMPTATGEQVHKGGGFVPYHTPKSPGRYYFEARTKLGGVLKSKKLEWYAGFHDVDNYVLFSLDGKHAEVREVRAGKQVVVERVPFLLVSDQWAEVEMSVKVDSVQARVKAGGGDWIELAPVTGGDRDFTKDTVGVYVPASEEVAIANFRFSNR